MTGGSAGVATGEKRGAGRGPGAGSAGRGDRPGWRILGVVLGVLLAFGGGCAVLYQLTNAGVSAGLYGTPGTYTVASCEDTNPSRTRSHYVCSGRFVPRGGTDGWAATLEGDDHRDGERLDVRRSPLGSDDYRRTGLWPTLGAVMWACFGLFFLAIGASQLGRRGSERKARVAAAIGIAGALLLLLDGVVALVGLVAGLG